MSHSGLESTFSKSVFGVANAGMAAMTHFCNRGQGSTGSGWPPKRPKWPKQCNSGHSINIHSAHIGYCTHVGEVSSLPDLKVIWGIFCDVKSVSITPSQMEVLLEGTLFLSPFV